MIGNYKFFRIYKSLLIIYYNSDLMAGLSDSSSESHASFATLDSSQLASEQERGGMNSEDVSSCGGDSSNVNVGASPTEQATSQTSASGPGASVRAPTSPKARYTCRKHDIVVSRYCYDCNSILCAECAQTAHRGHTYEDVTLAANRCRETVKERLEHMKSIDSFTRASLESVELRKTHILEQTEMAASEINKQFDQIAAVLQQRREELLDRLAEMSVRKMKSLCEQEQALSLVVKSVEELSSRVQNVMAVSGDEELINMQQQLEVLMNQEAAKHAHIPRLPVEVPDIIVDVHCLEEVKNICRAGTRVYQSNFSGEGIARAAVGKEACFSLRCSTSVPQPAGVKAVLVSVADNSVVVPMKVSSHECSTVYQVTYTPKVRGHHHICAEENGKVIGGSPLDVFVSIEVDQMGAVNRTIGALHCPTALDFSSKDLALISQQDTDYIAVRTRLGKKVQEIKNARFRSCWGITIDNEDNIYVSVPHSVIKLDKDGRLIKMVGEKGAQHGEFDNPRGIHVIGKKLYVCDRDNSRIQVFTLGLQLLGVIKDKATKWATDVAGSSDGRLYVIGQGVPSVQVFTADHVYSSSIHHQDLSFPAAICFNPIQQQLFVVDCNSSGTCVFVFGLDGQFIATLPVEGSSGVSYGIATDIDGFVYVCDGSKNLIHVL